MAILIAQNVILENIHAQMCSRLTQQKKLIY